MSFLLGILAGVALLLAWSYRRHHERTATPDPAAAAPRATQQPST